MRNVWLMRISFAGALLLLLASTVGCHESTGGAAASTASQSVTVSVLKEEITPATEDVPGSFTSSLHALIEAKVQSRIEHVLAVPGQRVKANDVVVELDSRELKTKYDQAIAVRDQAEKDLKRYQTLFEKHAVTQKELDAAEANARVARAGVSEAETFLSYTKIKAPYDGVIARKLMDVGDLATPGKPVLEIQDPGVLEFQADVPEALIGGVTQGASLLVRASASETPLQGAVTEIAPTADPNSRTFLIKLKLPATEGLRSGQFGRVEIPRGERKITRVPNEALLSRGQLEYVFVKSGDKALLRIVRSGKRFPRSTEILSGLSPGDEVITTGADALIDGNPITVTP